MVVGMISTIASYYYNTILQQRKLSKHLFQIFETILSLTLFDL